MGGGGKRLKINNETFGWNPENLFINLSIHDEYIWKFQKDFVGWNVILVNVVLLVISFTTFKWK